MVAVPGKNVPISSCLPLIIPTPALQWSSLPFRLSRKTCLSSSGLGDFPKFPKRATVLLLGCWSSLPAPPCPAPYPAVQAVGVAQCREQFLGKSWWEQWWEGDTGMLFLDATAVEEFCLLKWQLYSPLKGGKVCSAEFCLSRLVCVCLERVRSARFYFS